MRNKKRGRAFSLKARIIAITTALLIAASWIFACQVLLHWSRQVIDQAAQGAVNAQELLIESVHAYMQGKARARDYSGLDVHDNQALYVDWNDERWSSITRRDITDIAQTYYTPNGTFRISHTDGGLIYSTMQERTEAGIGLNPPETGETLAVLRQIGGQKIIYVSSYVRFLPTELSRVDLALDVTDTVLKMERTILQALLLQIALSAALMAALWHVIGRTLSPLYDLGRQARAMAKGKYSLRANIWKEDEVGALAAEFNQMAEAVEAHTAQLSEIARRRELFAANLSHEMKTPLTSIVGYADLATSMALDPAILSDPGKTRALIDMLDFIKREGRRLDTLSKILLEWSALYSGQEIDRRVIKTDRLLRHMLHILQHFLDENGQMITVQSTVSHIYADEALMISLLANLCKNAAKASAPHAAVQLLLDSAPDGTLCITVADNGVGMAPEEIQHITEPFYMVDRARDRRTGGTGMGLALCQAIVQAHGGEMEIQSEKNVGTRIRIVLPDGAAADRYAETEAQDES